MNLKLEVLNLSLNLFLFIFSDLIPCEHNSPCQNGATCSNTGAGGYTCTCPSGYNGLNCQNDIDECASDPCSNGGSCMVRKTIFHITIKDTYLLFYSRMK